MSVASKKCDRGSSVEVTFLPGGACNLYVVPAEDWETYAGFRFKKEHRTINLLLDRSEAAEFGAILTQGWSVISDPEGILQRGMFPGCIPFLRGYVAAAMSVTGGIAISASGINGPTSVRAVITERELLEIGRAILCHTNIGVSELL